MDKRTSPAFACGGILPNLDCVSDPMSGIGRVSKPPKEPKLFGWNLNETIPTIGVSIEKDFVERKPNDELVRVRSMKSFYENSERKLTYRVDMPGESWVHVDQALPPINQSGKYSDDVLVSNDLSNVYRGYRYKDYGITMYELGVTPSPSDAQRLKEHGEYSFLYWKPLKVEKPYQRVDEAVAGGQDRESVKAELKKEMAGQIAELEIRLEILKSNMQLIDSI